MNRRVRASPISPSGVRSGVREIATETMGGVWQEMELFCGSTYFPMLLCCGCLSTTARPDRAALAVRGRTGATPPFLPLERQTVKGGVKLDHQGGAKPDHYGNGEGFVLLDLRGWLERRPAPPLGGAFRPEWKAPLQIVATCRQGKSGTTFGGQASWGASACFP